MRENSTTRKIRANERVGSGLRQVFNDLAGGGDSDITSPEDPTEEFDAPDAHEKGRSE